MRAAILNPIRFYDSSKLPDFTTNFPNFDNTPRGIDYFYGQNTVKNLYPIHYGEMYLQFLNEDNVVKEFTVYKQNYLGDFDADSTVSTVDISPAGWVGYQIHKLTLDLSDGLYYVKCGTYISDTFLITSSQKYLKNLIKIEYSNSINDFGCIFDTNYFTAYMVGLIQPGESGNEIEGFTSDRGNPIKLKATPRRNINLLLKAVNNYYLDLIDFIFSCDDININGVDFVNIEAPTRETNENVDTGAVSIKLTRSVNDYYYE